MAWIVAAAGRLAGVSSGNPAPPKLYFEESDGVWIRDCPPALAFFFNTGEGATRRSAESRKTGPDRAKGLISLDVSPNEMASWIQVHLNRFGLVWK